MMLKPVVPSGTMRAEEFVLWAQSAGEGERYELVDGVPLRLQAETARHAVTKATIWAAFREALRAQGITGCQALPDGVSVRVADDQVREPDTVINCGKLDPDDVFAPDPVVVVEVVSPSTARVDMNRKIVDYFRVPSIVHYLIVFAKDRQLVHHRKVAGGEIDTRILSSDDTVALDPPGIRLPVSDFFSGLPEMAV